MLCRTLFLGVAVPLREHEQQLDVALLHEAWSSSSSNTYTGRNSGSKQPRCSVLARSETT